MDFKVGSLADYISGIKSPKASKDSKLFDTGSSENAVNIRFEALSKEKKKKPKRKKELGSFTEKPAKQLEFEHERKSYNEDSENEASNSNNALKRIERKNKKKASKKQQEMNSKYNERSVFVGNVPHTVSKRKVKKFFEKYGTVEAVRLRSAPLADARVPKKVAVITKQFHAERNSMNAYVRYAEIDSARKALATNGTIFEGHHIRVDMADGVKADRDSKKAVFLGNVPFAAEEDELWKMFEACGNISSIRIIRDSRTGVGKGFAYINFESSDAVELALKLDGEELKKRKLRVKRCVKKPPKSPDSRNKKQNLKNKSEEVHTSDLDGENNDTPKETVNMEEEEEDVEVSDDDDDDDDDSGKSNDESEDSDKIDDGGSGSDGDSYEEESENEKDSDDGDDGKGKKKNFNEKLSKSLGQKFTETNKIKGKNGKVLKLQKFKERKLNKKSLKLLKKLANRNDLEGNYNTNEEKITQEMKVKNIDKKLSPKKPKAPSNFQGQKVSEKKSGKKKKRNEIELQKKAMIHKLNPKSKLPVKKAKMNILQKKSLAKKIKFKPSKK